VEITSAFGCCGSPLEVSADGCFHRCQNSAFDEWGITQEHWISHTLQRAFSAYDRATQIHQHQDTIRTRDSVKAGSDVIRARAQPAITGSTSRADRDTTGGHLVGQLLNPFGNPWTMRNDEQTNHLNDLSAGGET